MKTADFNKFLFTVNDVPFPGTFLTVTYVTSLEESIFIETIGVGVRVLKVTRNDSRASNANLAACSEG